jgi:hypothetical protein
VFPQTGHLGLGGVRDVLDVHAAWRFLEEDAAHLGVPFDAGSVLERRAEGVPDVHITAASGELVRHLAVTEADPLADGSAIMVRARAGAHALMSRIELGEGGAGQPLLVGENKLDDGRHQRESGAGHENAPGRSGPEILLELDSLLTALTADLRQLGRRQEDEREVLEEDRRQSERERSLNRWHGGHVPANPRLAHGRLADCRQDGFPRALVLGQAG